MTPEQFTESLKGYIEMTDGRKPSEVEWQKIVEKLQSVFKKETKIPSGPIPRGPLVLQDIPDCEDLNLFPLLKEDTIC